MARAFLIQHKHAMDFTPDRLSLQTMEKKYSENFKEYAQRWGTMAIQVQPPLVEKEITMLFLNTLQEPYYDRFLPSATRNFADMIMVGNLVDHAIKNKKIDVRENSFKSKGKGNFTKKKEGEIQALFQGNQPSQSRGYISY